MNHGSENTAIGVAKRKIPRCGSLCCDKALQWNLKNSSDFKYALNSSTVYYVKLHLKIYGMAKSLLTRRISARAEILLRLQGEFQHGLKY